MFVGVSIFSFISEPKVNAPESNHSQSKKQWKQWKQDRCRHPTEWAVKET